jgi:predicted pyridoxine 5'-phosphate oxidase superfamily flavin-nucleotide-binding protein
LRRWRVSLAKKPSTASSQDAEVGVKWKVQRGCRASHSPKGSLKVWDDETVVFADIASPGTIRNLCSNPFIEINLVDPFLRRGFRFKGRAEVYESGPEFDFVAEALWSREGRQYPVNAVVKVTVEQALPVLSPVYMFNDKVSEQDVKAIWLKRYGVAARSAHEVDQGM